MVSNFKKLRSLIQRKFQDHSIYYSWRWVCKWVGFENLISPLDLGRRILGIGAHSTCQYGCKGNWLSLSEITGLIVRKLRRECF